MEREGGTAEPSKAIFRRDAVRSSTLP